ncbi:MAG: recombinase family protein [Actinomycetota bacterium]
MKVAIYARTSRAEGGDETSIPVQLADCRERADEESWTVTAEYVDAGISGWKRRSRPGYEALFADAAEGRIDAVLVRDYERLLRNDKEGARWLDLYEAQGFARFEFADEASIKLRRARDRKDFKDRVSAAVYYSDRLSEKVRRTKKRQAASGEYMGGEREPFGYQRQDGSLLVDPEEAGIIHDAVARLEQGVPVGRVTADLNRQGLRTSRGALWRPRSMRRMLLSEHLTGARGYSAIISEDEAAVVRAAFAQDQPTPGHPSGRRHPLSGLLVCGECEVKMTGATDKYRCNAAAGGCGWPTIQAFPLERYVLFESLKHFMETREERSTQPEPVPDPGALSELREVAASLQETQGLVGEGLMSPADAAPILARLRERQREAAEAVARTLQTAPEPPVKRLSQVFTAHEVRWETRDPEAVQVVNDLALTQVERVIVSRRAVRGRGFDSKRVKVVWKRLAQQT